MLPVTFAHVAVLSPSVPTQLSELSDVTHATKLTRISLAFVLQATGPGNKANILQVGDSPTENSYHFTGKSKAAGNIICVGEEKPADEPANKHVTSAKGKQCM